MKGRTALALLVCALLAGVPGARAQDVGEPSLGGTLADIERCLAETPDNPRGCAGQLADRCQEQPEGATTPGIVSCLAQETALWDGLLNRRYAETVERTGESGPEAVASLRDAQRKWIAFRDAECGRLHDLWAGGTIRLVVHASCLLDRTAGRAVELAPEAR